MEATSRKMPGCPKSQAEEFGFQSFAVTEPGTGSDTTRLKTTAKKKDSTYYISGQKVWISRVRHSDLMLLLARTSPYEKGSEPNIRSFGISG